MEEEEKIHVRFSRSVSSVRNERWRFSEPDRSSRPVSMHLHVGRERAFIALQAAGSQRRDRWMTVYKRASNGCEGESA